MSRTTFWYRARWPAISAARSSNSSPSISRAIAPTPNCARHRANSPPPGGRGLSGCCASSRPGIALHPRRLDAGHGGFLDVLRGVAGDAGRADDLAAGILDENAALLRRE